MQDLFFQIPGMWVEDGLQWSVLYGGCFGLRKLAHSSSQLFLSLVCIQPSISAGAFRCSPLSLPQDTSERPSQFQISLWNPHRLLLEIALQLNFSLCPVLFLFCLFYSCRFPRGLLNKRLAS